MTVAQPAPAPGPPAAAGRTLTLLEAIREALHDEMARDSRVVVLGEDVGQLGGVFRATDGLLGRFGSERVIDTPMMELGIVGVAVGMAMRGLRPVAEIQFADFIHAAADHIITDAARLRFRSAGDWSCPLVIRTAYGGGFRGGPYHSQSVEAFYTHVPGLKVVAPSFPADAKGLLIASIRDPDPVLFLEHKRTYRAIKGEVPEGDRALPLGQGRVVRPGRDATLVAWGWALHEGLAAADELAQEGIEVEVVDPRTLIPLDDTLILESVRKTGRLCVAHEDTRTMGFGAELAARAAERALEVLRAPVRRVAMPDVAGIPASGPMEDFLIPDRARIAAAVRELARVDRGRRGQSEAERPLAPGESRREDGATGQGAGTTPSWADLATTSATQVPQASSVVEVDLTRVAEHLEQHRGTLAARGLPLSHTPYFVQALAAALAALPQANAAFDARTPGIRRYHAVHVGLSVLGKDDTARHAVVRDADTRNLLGCALEVQAARERGEHEAGVLVQATATLADYGPGSALFAVPPVLPGQAVAVRVGAVEDRLITRGRGFVVAPSAYLCAAIDHRALDGADAGALLGAMKRFLEQYPLEPDA